MTAKKEPIVIASDHYGMILKNPIRDYLIEKGYEVIDLGVNSEEPVLYPEIAVKLSEEVVKNNYSRGILVCGTGIGMAMVANKVPGVRAAVIHDAYSAERARASNDAQVAALGSLVGKPPHVAEADRAARRRQDEPRARAERLAPCRACCHFAPLEACLSLRGRIADLAGR